eukprot:RCo011283
MESQMAAESQSLQVVVDSLADCFPRVPRQALRDTLLRCGGDHNLAVNELIQMSQLAEQESDDDDVIIIDKPASEAPPRPPLRPLPQVKVEACTAPAVSSNPQEGPKGCAANAPTSSCAASTSFSCSAPEFCELVSASRLATSIHHLETATKSCFS